jgi:uncharacterized protein YecE (DUF72 family)
VIERFDYLYLPSELEAFVEPIRRIAERAEEVHAVFNNCVRNYAVLNAKDLAVLLERADHESSAGMAENTDHVTQVGSP